MAPASQSVRQKAASIDSNESSSHEGEASLKTPTEILPNRMSHVDAICAVAVLFVMWTHYPEQFSSIAGSGQWLDTLQHYGNFGRIGVVVFFALSGC